MLKFQIESQEMLLYDHRQLRCNNVSLTSDYSSTQFSSNANSSNVETSNNFLSIRDELQWIRQHLTDKEDELAKAMNQVEDLTYHLKNVKNFR